MDMKKLLGIVSGQQQLNESIQECGEMPAATPANPPVTMSVNLNAQGIDHIKELLGLMQSASSPLAAGPVDKAEPMAMPTPGMPVGAPAIDAEKQAPVPDIADLDDIIKLAGVPALPKKELGDTEHDDMAADEEQAEPGTGEMMQDIAGEISDMADELSGEENDEETDEGAYDASTTPDPEYQDTNYMIKDLAGGLNKEKKMFKHSYKQGDNPMAMESVKQELVQRYQEIKNK